MGISAMGIQTKLELSEIIQQISSLIPDDVRAVRADIEKNIQSTLTAGLRKMELVTREEFDTQTAVLQKTRQKLGELQNKLDEIEKKLD